MNDEQLARSVQSIGMGCFVKYFEAFNNGNISNEDLIDALMKIEGYEETGVRTRVTQSRRIIKDGRAVEALKLVTSSNRAEDWAVSKAQLLINTFKQES